MHVFLVSNYPQHSSFYQTLQQVTAATFARSGYEVSFSSLNSGYEQQLNHSMPAPFIKDSIRVQSDRNQMLTADKIVFQLLIEGQGISQNLENWFRKIFDEEFIHFYAHILSKKSALIILSQETTNPIEQADTLGQKVLIEYLVNKYLKVADIKVMPTHIFLNSAPASRLAEKNYIVQFSKKIQFYALLLSSSIYTAS